MQDFTIRKLVIQKEIIEEEAGAKGQAPITRVAGIAIINNPYAGQYVEDLAEFFDVGALVAELLMSEMTPLLTNDAVSYGKSAIVGVAGDIEQGHAMLHPKLGKMMREPIGGGEALIPSAAKVAVAGSTIDIPLGHKDDAWSFDHFDAMTVSISDAPRPNEILLALAIADGGRLIPRVGKSRAL